MEVQEQGRQSMYTHADHTFAVCAYKESPYLQECIESLRSQTATTRIILCTSTPGAYLEGICRQFKIPLYVNQGESGIAADWNYAVSCVDTPLVTIAHQDDRYEPAYAAHMLEAVNSAQHPLLFFTNYGEIREGNRVDSNTLLSIKRKMLAPLKRSGFKNSRFMRRRVLSFGSAICCPSVTMVLPNLETPIFQNELKCNLDWQAWERISKEPGAFLYDPGILMYHRIHEESETTALIRDNTRTHEDIQMLELFWPKPLAHLLAWAYLKGQQSNGGK